MKLSTYLSSLEEVKGRLPEGIDPEVTFTVSFLYGNCLQLDYVKDSVSYKVEVRPTETGLMLIDTKVAERVDAK